MVIRGRVTVDKAMVVVAVGGWVLEVGSTILDAARLRDSGASKL